MYGLILWLLSFVKLHKANKLTLNDDDMTEMWPDFEDWVVGHDAALHELLSSICVLKRAGKGGVIVLGGSKQRGTKHTIMTRLAGVWGELVGNAGAAPLQVSERKFRGNQFDKNTLRNLYLKEKRTLWVSTTSAKSHVVKALIEAASVIEERKVLCILDVQEMAPVGEKYGKMDVVACVNLEADKQQLEATLREKWAEDSTRTPLQNDEVLHAIMALSVDSSPECFETVIKLIVAKRGDFEPAENSTSKKAKLDGVAQSNNSGANAVAGDGGVKDTNNTSASHNTTSDSHNPTTSASHNSDSNNSKSNNTNSQNTTQLQPAVTTDMLGGHKVALNKIFDQQIPAGHQCFEEEEATRQSTLHAEFNKIPKVPLSSHVLDTAMKISRMAPDFVTVAKVAENALPLITKVVDVAGTVIEARNKRKSPEPKDDAKDKANTK